MQILLVLLTISAHAQNPLSRVDPFSGTFESEQVVLQLSRQKGEYNGSLTIQGSKYSVAAKSVGEKLDGRFQAGERAYGFTLIAREGGVILGSEGHEYFLPRKIASPARTDMPTGQDAASGIIGLWRNSTGSARFNADGTAVVDGESGQFVTKGNQLTLIGSKAQITLQYALAGDVLTLSPTGPASGNGTITLNRVREGSAGIRPELVGKWCWVSVVNAQQGAAQSSQCVTLAANGNYLYSGETDSYNPYGGVTTNSSDSGMWTATETTLTARSSSGKVTTYSLEKRNHPKNKDPMIVLNGQTFVSFYNKPPW